MLGLDLATDISNLSSSKVRDRNDALQRLEQAADSSDKFTNKELATISEALFMFIDSEKSTYLKSQTAPVLSRLELGTYVLRKLIVKHTKQLRSQLVKSLLQFIQDGLFGSDNELFAPLALEFSKILRSILVCDDHRDNISTSDWVKLVSTVLQALRSQFRRNFSEKVVNELLLTLRSLLTYTMTASSEIGYNLSEFIVEYFSSLKKENSLTELVLEVSNQALVSLSTSKVSFCIDIVKAVVKVSSELVNTNYEALKDQSIIFAILAAEYINSDLPKLIDDDGNFVETFDLEFHENLVRWIDAILRKHTKNSDLGLSISMIEFVNTPSFDKHTNEASWISFPTMRLCHSSYVKHWLHIYSTTALMNALYSIDAVKRQDEEKSNPVWKRRKLDTNTFIPILNRSSSSIDLLISLLSSSDTIMQQLSLQMLIFHLNAYQTDTSSIEVEKLMLFEKSKLAPWVSLALKTLLESGWTPPNETLSQLMRVHIQMLKDPELDSVASQTIIQIINSPNFILNDRTLVQLVESVFEISEISGPATVSNDTMKFWVVFYELGKALAFGDKKAGDKIVDWLASKWNHIDINTNLSILPNFISWLVGADFVDNTTLLVINDTFTNFNSRWNQTISLSKRILRTKFRIANDKQTTSWGQTSPALKFKPVEAVLESFIELLNSLESIENSTNLTRFVGYALLIYQHTCDIAQFSNTNEKLRFNVIRLMGNLTFNSNRFTLDSIRAINEFVIVDSTGAFIVENIDEQVLIRLVEGQNKETTNAVENFGDFGSIRKDYDHDGSFSLPLTPYNIHNIETIEQQIMTAIVNIHTKFGLSTSLTYSFDRVLQFLDTLSPTGFCSAFYSLLTYLETLDITKLHRASVKGFLRLFGTKLLANYRFQKSPVAVFLMSKLALIISDFLLMKGSEDLVLDFTDIFDWFLKLASMGQLGEESSIAIFLKCSFNLLSAADMLQASDVTKIFTTTFKVLGTSSNFVKYVASGTLEKLLKVSSLEKCQDVFSEFLSAFKSPQSYNESSATFTLVFFNLSQYSYTYFVQSISQLLVAYEFSHTQPYIEDHLAETLMKRGLKSLKDLPDSVLLDLFFSWYSSSNSFFGFPFKLLDYGSENEFMIDQRRFLFPILKSRKNQNPQELSNLIQLIEVDEESILLETMSLAIPLAYTKDGIRNDMRTKITDLYDVSLVEHQSIMIIQRLLQLVDVSDEMVFINNIPGISALPILKSIVSGSSPTLYPLVNSSINFPDAVHQILLLTKKFDFWSPPKALFVMKNILRQLQEAIDDDESRIVLRRLKLLIILSHTTFQSEEVLSPFVKILEVHLINPGLHDEVALLLLTVFKISKANPLKSSLYPGGLLSLFQRLVEFQERGHLVSNTLKAYLMDMYAQIDSKSAWKILFSPFFDVLSNRHIRITLNILHEALKYTSQTSRSHFNVGVLGFMKLVLEKNPEISHIGFGFKTNKEVATFLLNSMGSIQSKKVLVFIGKYLSRFFIETGDDLRHLHEDFERSFEYNFDEKTTSLDYIFDELFKLKEESSDLEEQNSIDEVFGFILYEYNTDAGRVKELLNFENYLSKFAKILLPLDSFTFDVLNPLKSNVLSLDSVWESDMTEIEWSQNICIAILEDLGHISAVSKPLVCFLSKFPEFSTNIMVYLWMFYARHGGHSGSHNLLSFITVGLNNAMEKKQNLEKTRIVLETCHFVRIAAREELKPFVNIYDRLNCEHIYKLAANSSMKKFALLVFEEFFTSSKRSNDLFKYSSTLTKIYENLEDPDLMFGIPVDPSLDYAMNIFNKLETSSWNTVMFNSASFDSSIILNSSLYSKQLLLSSLSKNSLDGLSSLTNNYVDPVDRLANSYDWCWKLNQWELPSPSKPRNISEMTYKILKSIKEKESPAVIEGLCEDSMSRLLSDGSNNASLLKNLSTIFSINSIFSGSNLNVEENCLEFSDVTDSWFTYAPFSTFEDLLLVRRITLNNISDHIGLDNSLITTSLEISRYGKFARIHGEKQRSINATVLLDSMVKSIKDSDIKPLLKKLSNFESARTLWNQGETVIPIAILSETLNKGKGPNSYSGVLSDHFVDLSDSVLNSLLIRWNSESKQKTFEDIMQNHVEDALAQISDVRNLKGKAKVYHEIGYFCYKQTKAPGSEEELRKKTSLLYSKKTELEDLKVIYGNKKNSEKERQDAKRYYKRISLQYDSDKDELNGLVKNRELCISKAIEFFLKTISIDNTFDDEDLDKLCALWLQFSNEDYISEVFTKEVKNVPSFKFIPWINQLVSRLSNESTIFQKSLQKLLIDICLNHPYHSLFYITNLRVQGLYEISKNDKSVRSRIQAADSIWSKLTKIDSNFKTKVLNPIEDLATNSISLATEKFTTSQEKKLHLSNLKHGDFWLKTLPTLNIPLPTMNSIPVSPNGNYDSLPRIQSVSPNVSISSSGISLPKILKVVLSNGLSQRLLLKGGSDDLRQDSIMEQVFEKVNSVLQKEKETRRRGLKIRTYKVIPLGPNAGMIEFVADSIALSDILRPLHRKDLISFEESRGMMKEAQQKSTRERINVFTKICKDTKPVFRHFFHETFANVDDWYKSRQIYTRGVAVTSIVGYILGLGDRHLNNVLIDQKTGEPIHIDLGVAFDQGKLLPVPETVPFRLTRDMVDGLGVTGVKGSFEKSSEHVFRVLRENSERIVSILDVLKYDPLYSWAISPIRKRKLQDIEDSSKSNVEGDGSDAGRAVKSVADKLAGNGLSIEATTQQLIQEATDTKNLSVIYLGWTPFY